MEPFLAIDCGTTNTRVWLIRDGQVAARAEVMAGVRDTARTGSVAALREGISQAVEQATARSGSDRPSWALAAGMITSNLGLNELPHAPAPVSSGDLAQAVEAVSFPELDSLTVYFVRGVRTGPIECRLDEAPQCDIIRGEETEIFGALETLGAEGPLLYIHLGSHTKMVRIDRHNRIASGITTLAGELDYVVRTQTILAGSLKSDQAEPFDGEMLDRGAAWVEQYGLSRSLFLIRILDQSGQYTTAQLVSLFAGAIAFGDIQAIRGHRLAEKGTSVILSGRTALQPVWRRFLQREGFEVTGLSEAQIEGAFLAGLQQIVFQSPAFAEGHGGAGNTAGEQAL